MSDASQTADDLAPRIRELFTDVAEEIESAASSDDGFETADDLDDPGRETLRTHGAKAQRILSETDPASLLASLGLDGRDGPRSIPEAILTGDPADVAELRVLLSLSRLAPSEEEADTNEADAGVTSPLTEDEREAMVTIADLLDVAGEPTDDESGAEEGDNASATTDDEAEPDAITSALQEALESTRTGIDDVLETDELDVDAAMDRVSQTLDGEADEEAETAEAGEVDEANGPADGDATDEEGAGDSDEETTGEDGGLVETASDVVEEAGALLTDTETGDDTEEGGAEDADENGTDADDDTDGPLGSGDDDGLFGDEDGLLGGDEDEAVIGGSDGGSRQSVSGFARGTYSTIPSQDRPDMNGVRRYSTKPDR